MRRQAPIRPPSFCRTSPGTSSRGPPAAALEPPSASLHEETVTQPLALLVQEHGQPERRIGF